MEGAVQYQPVAGSLAERYARIAHHHERRPVDRALRGLDIALATGSFVADSPVLAVIAAAIQVSSGETVFYRGHRVGRAGISTPMSTMMLLSAMTVVILYSELGET